MSRRALSVLVALFSIALAGRPALAADPPEAPARPAKGAMAGMDGITWPGIDLPAYQAPDAYSVDLVIHSAQGDMVMKRFIDGGRMRTEISADGQDFVMIEMGDEKGTLYTLMPEEKRAIKTSTAMMADMGGGKLPENTAEPTPATPEGKIEDLGDETIEGRPVKKLRMTVDEGSALGWFDRETGAPVRFESTVDGQDVAMDWKNYSPGPQPAKLFEVPKNYEVTDMEQAMAQMKSMGGMGGMGALAGSYAGGMAQNFGQGMGANLGASLGGALGGPLGAMAGQYIGGKIGGMLGKKVAGAVLPGQ